MELKDRSKKPRPALAARRVTLGLTQERLAALMQVNVSTVARWEQGAAVPRPWQRPKLAGHLETTLEGLDRLLHAPEEPSVAVTSRLKSRMRVDKTNPNKQRGFFGRGPMTIAIPLREVHDRPLPVISTEDALASHRLGQFLGQLGMEVGEFRVPTHGVWEPPMGDVIAICGPKSSITIAEVLADDPFLAYEPDGQGLWSIRERGTSRPPFVSPLDTSSWPGPLADVAYVARLGEGHRAMLVIAGIHALGSLGAVDFLVHNLTELYETVGTNRFSMVVRSEHVGEAVVRTELLSPPRIHP